MYGHLADLARNAPVGRAQKQVAFRAEMFGMMADRPEHAEEIYQQLAPLEDQPPRAHDIADRQIASDAVAQACAPPLHQSHYTYLNPDGVLLLLLRGEFAFGLLDVPGLLKQIEQAKEVHLHINCTGGDMGSAFCLFDALEGKCSFATAYGKCWSAATVVFLAAPVRRVAANTTLMVHAAVAAVYGNATSLRRVADNLDANDQQVRNIYSLHVAPATVATWLASGDHWLTPEQAVACGLATEIVSDPMCQCEICTDP